MDVFFLVTYAVRNMSYVPSSNLVPLVPRIRHEYSVSVESVDFKKGKFHNDL